jgi:GntR family transcriptional regulator, transcriptional repressor for pyruvate dehydrogenase complex
MRFGSGRSQGHRVSQDVAILIRSQILKGLRSGDKLPIEPEIAQMLGVSRSSVKDAIRTLELMGMVEPRSGAGTVMGEFSTNLFINPAANALVRHPHLLREFLDFRKILEPSLAALAARYASAREIAEMKDTLCRQQRQNSQRDVVIVENPEFHRAIAKASENTLVLEVLDGLLYTLSEIEERCLEAQSCSQRLLASHRRIVAAIQRHNVTEASAAMRRHIEEIEETVLHKI